MAENKEIWEDWAAESLPDVDVSEVNEMPSWYGNPVETQETTGEIRNPDNDVYSRISRLVGKIKNVPGVMSYYAHKIADPMYANVDYMGQQVGDWAAKKVNNIARAFDISPEARQYGRFEAEEYDPENVDVRFGKNAYKEGYDNLGDYLEAKDQEKVDRYRGYNHANRFAPIESADENFYNLSDTQTMEDWKPETTSGKIAKGAIETAGDMLPETLKALAEEKGINAGAKMLGMLGPAYVKAKKHWDKSEKAWDKWMSYYDENGNYLPGVKKGDPDAAMELHGDEYDKFRKIKDKLRRAEIDREKGKELVQGLWPDKRAKEALSTDKYQSFLEQVGMNNREADAILSTIDDDLRYASPNEKIDILQRALNAQKNADSGKIAERMIATGNNRMGNKAYRRNLFRNYQKNTTVNLGSNRSDFDYNVDTMFGSNPNALEKRMISRIAEKKKVKPLLSPQAQSAAAKEKLNSFLGEMERAKEAGYYSDHNFETPEALVRDIKYYLNGNGGDATLMSKRGVAIPEGFTKADFDDVVRYLARPKNTAITWEPELGTEGLVEEFNRIADVYKQERPWFNTFMNADTRTGAKMLKGVAAQVFPPSVSPNGWVTRAPQPVMEALADEIAVLIENGELITKDQVYTIMEMIKDGVADDLGAALY